jgi:hypothetical protein
MSRLTTRWPPAQRRQFILCLTDTADPQAAARLVGRTLFDAFALKDADPAFAADWERAVGIVWACVEFRVLAELMAPDAPDSAGGTRSRKASGFLDTKVALAIVQGRPNGPASVAGRAVPGAVVDDVRDEIRRLASASVATLSGTLPGAAAKAKTKAGAKAGPKANGHGPAPYLNGNGHAR